MIGHAGNMPIEPNARESSDRGRGHVDDTEFGPVLEAIARQLAAMRGGAWAEYARDAHRLLGLAFQALEEKERIERRHDVGQRDAISCPVWATNRIVV